MRGPNLVALAFYSFDIGSDRLHFHDTMFFVSPQVVNTMFRERMMNTLKQTVSSITYISIWNGILLLVASWQFVFHCVIWTTRDYSMFRGNSYFSECYLIV